MKAIKKIFVASEGYGLACGTLAYTLWGIFPLYWKMLNHIDSVQILMHRVVWSFVITFFVLMLLGKGKQILAVMKQPRKFFAVSIAGFLITANWGIYIYAVISNRIIETSLGYYLNPLVSVALASIILKERLDKGMIIAGIVAMLGIIILTISYGYIPWVSLSLAFSFSLYGFVKKLIGLDALLSINVETMPVLPIAIIYLLVEHSMGRGAIFNVSIFQTVLLVMSGIVTAIPLFFYSEGVKYTSLSKMGFLQYISPTAQLFFGIFLYGEKLGAMRAWAFACIVLALVVFLVSRVFEKKT